MNYDIYIIVKSFPFLAFTTTTVQKPDIPPPGCGLPVLDVLSGYIRWRTEVEPR